VLEVEGYDNLQGAGDGDLHDAEQVGWDGLVEDLHHTQPIGLILPYICNRIRIDPTFS
jgi:hypothetical protein